MSDKDEGSAEGPSAEYMASFAEFSGDTAPPAGRDNPKDGEEAPAGGEGGDPADPAKEDQPGADTPPAGAASDDPWANADPALKSLYEAQRARAEKAEQSDRSQRGRVAALQRKIGGDGQPAAERPHQAEQPKLATDEEREAQVERLKTLREDYPDVAAPLLDVMDQLRTELANLKPVVTEVSDDREAARLAAQYEALDKQHPDWKELAGDENFANWVGSQPEIVQKAANSLEAREVGIALSLFKTERAAAIEAGGGENPQPKPDDRRQEQLRGSRAIPGKGPAPTPGEPDGYEAAWSYHAERREKGAKRR